MTRLLLILCLALSLTTIGQAAQSPNVILIMTDDQGYGDLGVTGNPILKTPHIDKLAAGSAVMSQFYVSPVCTPTRASLMTGRWNYRTRAIDTYIGRAMMEPSEVTVAHILQKAGYATGIFGKWHLGDGFPLRAMDHGFGESLVIRGGGLRQPGNPIGGDAYFDPILEHNGKAVRAKGWCTDIFFDAAAEFIEKQHGVGKPFFVYLPTNAPHGPFEEVPEKDYAMYKGKVSNDRDARIFAMISNIDENVGKLMARLDALKVTNDTLVIFMTDNGPEGLRYNAGLRGQKAQVYDGGIRSFFYAHWPAGFKAGSASDRITAHIDVMPTLLEVCGVAKPEGLHVDGRSMLPLLRGEKPSWPDRTLFLQWHRGNEPAQYHNFAARNQRWKLVNNSNPGSEKLPGEPKYELFDMQADPGESKNLAAEHPDIVADLKKQYEQWFADVSSTRPNNYAPPRIVIGTPQGNPTLLTPQDIRAEVGAGWWVKGYWAVEVAKATHCKIRVIFRQDTTRPAKIRLTYGDLKLDQSVEAGHREYVFPSVQLPAGQGNLQVQVDEPQAPNNGTYHVEVSW